MSRFSCFLMGSESLLVQCAEILVEGGHEIRGVLTAAEPVKAWAETAGVPVVDPKAPLPALRARPFDYFFAITHLELVPEEILALPEKLAINFHDGPLPRYAGLNATSWALREQAETHGITWHVMTAGADEGDLLKQRIFDIAPGETALTLNTRCWEAGIETFRELAAELAEGRVQRTPQALDERSYFGRHDRPYAASTFTLQEDAAGIQALVRSLDTGTYANPLGIAKLWVGGEPWGVREVEVRSGAESATPGTVLAVEEDALVVACADEALALRRLLTPEGDDATPAELTARTGLAVGGRVERPAFLDELDALHRRLARHEPFWVRRLARLEAPEVPYVQRAVERQGEARFEEVLLALPGAAGGPAVAAAGVVALLARLSGQRVFGISFRDEATALAAPVSAAYARRVPLRVELRAGDDFASLRARIEGELARVRERGSYTRDVFARFPEIAGRSATPVALELAEACGEADDAGAELRFVVAPDGSRGVLRYDAGVCSRSDAERLVAHLRALLDAAAADPSRPVARLPLEDAATRERMLVAWNETARDHDRTRTLADLFEAQAAAAPDRSALIAGEATLDYGDLDRRANQLAHRLRELGVGRDVLVGLCTDRSLDMVVGMLGILKAGGAYVPLDPAFPAERLGFMIEDAGVPVLVAQEGTRNVLPPHEAVLVSLDGDAAALEALPATPPERDARTEDLAYVIYTSGSTGRPKGVQVEHRNVVNFFHGMDDRIGAETPGVWLAVTSLSFDISVLELLWTLTRGFTVVIHADAEREGAVAGSARAVPRPVDMSLFYFSADAGDDPDNKYRLLLEGARFADTHGFRAVWTPERHFHAFGGLYPNPAVTGAALAVATERVQIRAGSVVLPLHHPLRVAEEWSVVDNLSGGRVGISVAAGWQPNDFVLRPESFADAKKIMFRELENVRRLWRGETLTYPGPKGDVAAAILPRPLQAELPIWVTTAGSVETYEMAAAAGANVLTHLLGQTLDEVASKVARYREVWREHGHPGRGIVSLMLHTFVGRDDEETRSLVREPMKEYLRTAMSLVREAAWNFPTFKQRPDLEDKSFAEIFEHGLTDEERDAILEFAFERYYETSGLFGTVEGCLEMVARVADADVDDLACLIDFGVPTDGVLDGLKHLARLRERVDAATSTVADAGALSVGASIRRHGVTHLQCTPSMAGMFLQDEETRAALAGVGTVLLGGEALPEALARDVAAATPARVLNMYGPTETTIWSSTHEVGAGEGGAAIGRPIANTSLYVVDGDLEPVPCGVPGELLIGGEGVVRGYWNRPELTAERFVPDPFASRERARLYRTGDLVRWREDGVVEFLGRIDQQVKIRGYRIELGEIEARLAEHEHVREAVVVAREDPPGDKRLVAYLRAAPGARPDEADLREHLRERLPSYMVPAAFVTLERFPLTPNAKVDRKALPAPDRTRRIGRTGERAAPQNELQAQIAGVWQGALQLDEVGLDDNFFDLGGHSLLAVRVHRELKALVDRPLSITDLFRRPTVRALAAFLAGEGDDGAGVAERSEGRAAARRAAMERRRGRRRGSRD